MQLFDSAHLLNTYGYIGLFATILLESGVFFALPGDSLLFTAGLLAPSLHLNIWEIFIVSLTAAIFGNLLGYWIGTVLERLYKYRLVSRILPKKYIDRAHDFFEKKGKSAVFLARFMPVVRTFVPIVAGVVRMDKNAYTRYSVYGALAWTVVFLFSGFYLGKAFPQISDYLTYVLSAVVLVSILPAIYEWWKHRRRKGE